MGWVSYSFFAALMMAAADIFIKLAAGKLSNNLGVLIYGSGTFVLGLGWTFWQRIHGVPQHVQTAGVLAASGVGISFFLVTTSMYLAFEAGAPISVASPIIRLGGLLIASFVGLFFLREPLTLRYIAGMALSCIGIYLIITR